MVVRNKIKNQRGFTLVELMTVVAIIGVLASVGVPQYRKIQRKARRAEATLAMGVIASSEAAFFAEYQGYGDNLGGVGAELESAPQNYNVGFLSGATCDGFTTGHIFWEQNQSASTTSPGTFPGYGRAQVVFPTFTGTAISNGNKQATSYFRAIVRATSGLSYLTGTLISGCPTAGASGSITGCATGACAFNAVAAGNLYNRTGSDVKMDVMTIDNQRKITLIQDGT
jgi:prepilin-type N-terminal cleavage/methylation domain-containing protein